MTDGLPIATTGDSVDPPACPWCGAYPGEATFTLDALIEAQTRDVLFGFVMRQPDGTAPPSVLVADCPSCVRPFMAVMQARHGWRFARLLPCLTPTDVKYRESRR